MKRMIAAAALLVGSCAAPQPEQQSPPIELAGRSPGPPQRCVMLDHISALRVSDNDRHTVLYGSGRTIWANHLGQCGFRRDDILVTEPMNSSYCRGDLIRSFDRTSRIPGPTCIFSEFVPYRR